MRSPVRRLGVSVALGVAAAVVAVLPLRGEDDEAYGGAGDRVRAAVEGLRDDHVHVTEDGRAMLDEEGEAAVAAAIAERDLPVHVVVWAESRNAGYDHYVLAAEQMLHLLDEPSVLVLWQGPDTSVAVATPGYDVVDAPPGADPFEEPVASEPEYLGEAALRLPEWIAQLPDEPVERQEFDYYGGPVAGAGIGLLLGALGVLAWWGVLAVVVAVARTVRQGRIARAEGT
ncbi:hypothetical protein [Nocardioides solisilvae]|uniref:hypothetical protein n=1 Tax=Nocardioides solisilvae TaxID=1542435 RepID=UPI000D74E1EA|nr:hypothetical protein [Nocardioides solisilvae]